MENRNQIEVGLPVQIRSKATSATVVPIELTSVTTVGSAGAAYGSKQLEHVIIKTAADTIMFSFNEEALSFEQLRNEYPNLNLHFGDTDETN